MRNARTANSSKSHRRNSVNQVGLFGQVGARLAALQLISAVGQHHEHRNPQSYRVFGRVIQHTGVILPGKGAVSGSGGDGRLYVQRWQDMQEIPRLGMAGQPVFSYTEQGLADGCGTEDYVTLSETSVQLLILTSIPNYPLRTCRWRQ
jgi:hypothetical protein